jgi:SWI/SNF-related matrix-associated actin-dependent regulator 1 of chromatin subfamily A
VFCGRSVGYRWDFSGASNLDRLREELKPVMVRRLKKDVLPDLPEIVYQDDLVDLDGAVAREYRRAQEDFVAWYAEKGRTASAVEHLQKLTALRQLAVAGKVGGLLERLEGFREEGKKAIVFCGFLIEGLDKLSAALRQEECVRITGAENAEQRQAAVDRFQADPACLFALVSTAAGGVGITLTAADTVLFLDLPWTPGAKQQAEARAHRIGQRSSVQVVHLLARGTVDEAMAGVLREKAAVIAQAVDGVAPAPATDGDVAREVSGRLVGDASPRGDKLGRG